MNIRRIIYTLTVCIAFTCCLFGCKKKEIETVASEMIEEEEANVSKIENSEIISEETKEEATEELSKEVELDNNQIENSEETEVIEDNTDKEFKVTYEWENGNTEYNTGDGTKTASGYPAITVNGYPISTDIYNNPTLNEYFGHPDDDRNAHVDELKAALQKWRPSGWELKYSKKEWVYAGEHGGYYCFLMNGEGGFLLDKADSMPYTQEILLSPVQKAWEKTNMEEGYY